MCFCKCKMHTCGTRSLRSNNAPFCSIKGQKHNSNFVSAQNKACTELSAMQRHASMCFVLFVLRDLSDHMLGKVSLETRSLLLTVLAGYCVWCKGKAGTLYGSLWLALTSDRDFCTVTSMGEGIVCRNGFCFLTRDIFRHIP